MFHLSNIKKTIGFLILCLIICTCFTFFFTKVFGLDEWIDDYENENYVQWKENIIRNSTLDCMELNFTEGDNFEDFTTYTEVDEQNDITITQYKIEWDSMRRDADSYVYKDMGVNYFADFEHYINVNITDVEAGDADNRLLLNFWIVSTLFGDLDSIDADDYIGVGIAEDGVNDDKFRVDLRWYNGGVQQDFDTGIIRDVNIMLYLVLNRNDNDFFCYIYTDSNRTILNETLSMNNINTEKFRYISFVGLGYTNDPADYSSGYIEYLLRDGGRIYEDLNNDYTEVDNANNRITFPYGDYYVQYASHRAEWVYLYYDYGVNYFDDFVHELDCYMVSSPLYGIGFFYVLSNVIKAQRQMQLDNDNFFAIVFYYGGGGDEIQFRYCDGITTHQLGYSCNKMVWYYLRVIKNDTDIDLEIFSDSARTSLLDTLHFDLTSDEKFRYIYSCNGYGQSGYTQILTLYAKNYWIGKYNVTGGYFDDGIFYTKDVLDYVNGSSIVLLTESTIPSGDEIKVQFSPNNSSWYSHNAVLNGYDNLVAGLESIDMRDLNYSSSIFMRFNFSDGGLDSTPRLFQLRLITSANVTGGGPGPVTMGGGIGFVVGGWILLPPILLILGYMLKRGKRK